MKRRTIGPRCIKVWTNRLAKIDTRLTCPYYYEKIRQNQGLRQGLGLGGDLFYDLELSPKGLPISLGND